MAFTKLFTIFFFLVFSSNHLFAQSINGFEVFVSKNKLSSITFHSEVTNYYFERKNSPYKVSTLGKQAIMIQTSQEVTEPYTLLVIEGSRKHQFEVLYKEDIDLSEQDKDYSDLKQLEKLIKDYIRKPNAQNILPNPSQNADVFNPEENQDNSRLYQLISDADKAKKNQQLQEAKTKYGQDLKIDSENNYAQKGLLEVIKLIEKIGTSNYNDAITKANNAFSLNNLDESTNYYNEALKINPDDSYSKRQIQFIQKKAEASKIDSSNRENEILFSNYVNIGNKALENRFYDSAKFAYSEALKIKPEDQEIKVKLNSIDQKRQADSLDAENEKNEGIFMSFVNLGKKALEEKLYADARTYYNEALKLKPGNDSIITKLSFVEKQVTQNKAVEKYNNYIILGDKAFSEKIFDIAENNYKDALKEKLNDIYAQNQIRKTNKALAELAHKLQQELDQQKHHDRENEYSAIISMADKYYNSS